MMHIHTARHVLKESQQPHQYNQESGTHTEYIVPHGRRYDKISTLTRFSFITSMLGAIDANAIAANVSIIRFTHSI